MMRSTIICAALGAPLAGQAHALSTSAALWCGKLKAKENVIAAGLCSKQREVPTDECETMVKQGFEKVLENECPSHPPASSASLCREIKAKAGTVVTGVCSNFTKVPTEQCEGMVKQGLKNILEKECPSLDTAAQCHKLEDVKERLADGMAAQLQHIEKQDVQSMKPVFRAMLSNGSLPAESSEELRRLKSLWAPIAPSLRPWWWSGFITDGLLKTFPEEIRRTIRPEQTVSHLVEVYGPKGSVLGGYSDEQTIIQSSPLMHQLIDQFFRCPESSPFISAYSALFTAAALKQLTRLGEGMGPILFVGFGRDGKAVKTKKECDAQCLKNGDYIEGKFFYTSEIPRLVEAGSLSQLCIKTVADDSRCPQILAALQEHPLVKSSGSIVNHRACECSFLQNALPPQKPLYESTGMWEHIQEDAVVIGACSMQTQVPAHHCKAMVNEGFEKMLEKDGQSYLEALPALLCDELKAKGDVVVAGVCSKQTKVPAMMCETTAKLKLDMLLEKACPSQVVVV